MDALRVALITMLATGCAGSPTDTKTEPAPKGVSKAAPQAESADATKSIAGDAKAPPDTKADDAKSDDTKADPAPKADGEASGGEEDVGLDEPVGKLHLGMAAAEVEAELGKPTKKGKKQTEEATGDAVQTWTWKGKGVSIDMFDSPSGQRIGRFTIEAPSTFRTPRGIGIGSARAEVEKAYAKERDDEMSDTETFIAGSVYGGVFFHFAGDAVDSIFVGAGAE